ncbi:Ig-like domain-containing protein [Xenorhabdus sp. Sc-CR9]|uniref:Ig-like domain-containing protein n=1 Tax=Xenorhabdus sp. Sc-CR9 TaxID=2584468 RepID=UPI001F322E10
MTTDAPGRGRADGQDSVMYTVIVKDRDGEPVPDQTVNWSSDKGELSQTTQKTDAQGLAVVLLISHHRGEHSVQVSVGDNVTVALPVYFSAVLKPVITIDKTQAKADGQDAVTFTVTVNMTLSHSIFVSPPYRLMQNKADILLIKQENLSGWQ